jgi:hypothetical protein
MAFPSSPTDGQIYVKGSTPYVYSSASNSWTQTTDANLIAGNIKNGVSILGVTGTLSQGLGDIYITSLDASLYAGITSQGYSSIATPSSVNISNYIYSPIVFYAGGGGNLMFLYFTTDSSALPIRVNQTYPISNIIGYSITSVYLDSGILYFNDNLSKYQSFNTSSKTFSTNNSGSHTTGTLLSSPLVLNGFQYDSNIVEQPIGTAILVDIKVKVTKV